MSVSRRMLLLLAATAAMAACDGPGGKIREACIAEGGMKLSGAISEAEKHQSCDCFVEQLENTMTDDELRELSETVGPKGNRGFKGTPDRFAPKVMGATKSCAR